MLREIVSSGFILTLSPAPFPLESMPGSARMWSAIQLWGHVLEGRWVEEWRSVDRFSPYYAVWRQKPTCAPFLRIWDGVGVLAFGRVEESRSKTSWSKKVEKASSERRLKDRDTPSKTWGNESLKAMAPHSSTPAWKIPWTEEPGGLQSMGSRRVGHDWATSLSLLCIGEGNGNPLQCSRLENPREGGAWWAAIYGVAQSRTQLKLLSSSSSSMVVYTVKNLSAMQETQVQSLGQEDSLWREWLPPPVY